MRRHINTVKLKSFFNFYSPVTLAVLFLTWLSVLSINGALPYVLLSTLGQSIVVVGYAVSFLEQGGFALYSEHFGYPTKTPMTTMLAPAIAMRIFLEIGLHPADAFSASLMLWISFGYYGCFAIAKSFRLQNISAGLGALLWFLFPIVWNSSGYSHLHFGFAILPFLFYLIFIACRFINEEINPIKISIFALCYFLSVIVCVFTDGYTFMIFAIGSSMILGCFILLERGRAIKIKIILSLIHFFAFLFSYVMYVNYLGETEFTKSNMDFFRGWGLDISFALWPTSGVHMIWDTLGLSANRSSHNNFGDASVWVSTFIMPLFIAVIYYCLKINLKKPIIISLVAVSIFGFYLSLGPSLKIFSNRPTDVSKLMPREFGIISTGNSIFSEHLPGFSSMRASYRWITLTFFGLWCFLMLCMGYKKNQIIKNNLILLLLILLFMPSPSKLIDKKKEHRSDFFSIDKEVIEPLKEIFRREDIVAFLPYSNDFLVNYISPSLGIHSYNVGGDKNVALARNFWPAIMKANRNFTSSDSQFYKNILYFLDSREVDSILIPKIDLLWAAHIWPYPVKLANVLKNNIELLEDDPNIEFIDTEFFVVVRLKDGLNNRSITGFYDFEFCPPRTCIRTLGFFAKPLSLTGSHIDLKMKTTSQEGFLHFGPYSSVDEGLYSLKLFGNLKVPGNGFIDIVADKGRIEFFKKSLKDFSNEENIELIEEKVEVLGNFEDLEIRVYVTSETDFEFEGYEFIKISD